MNEANLRANARFVVITGLSGSGKSTALRALEDLGFYAVDNLPVELLPAFVTLPLGSAGEPFRAALVMDIRAPRFVENAPQVFIDLANRGFSLDILFLEASDAALVRRFSQTRRHHPLASDNDTIQDGIQRERLLMEPLRQQAAQIVDTSRFTTHELRREIFRLYSELAPPAPLQVNLLSFGFKYGLPPEADMVLDVRFLANPYFIHDLRQLDGQDARVVDYVFKQEDTGAFLSKLKSLLDFLLPRYRQEGKSQLTLAIGCTGGRHRSVAVVEWLARELKSPECRVTVRHRDLTLDNAT
ncbi:MAG: RNase adapter RapZ [Desulfarculus sp.]|nr:RNase adapter RapZ [Desulfarculus sp.]